MNTFCILILVGEWALKKQSTTLFVQINSMNQPNPKPCCGIDITCLVPLLFDWCDKLSAVRFYVWLSFAAQFAGFLLFLFVKKTNCTIAIVPGQQGMQGLYGQCILGIATVVKQTAHKDSIDLWLKNSGTSIQLFPIIEPSGFQTKSTLFLDN